MLMFDRESNDGLDGAGVHDRWRLSGEGDGEGGVIGLFRGEPLETKEDDGDEDAEWTSPYDEDAAVDANEKVVCNALLMMREGGVEGRVGVPGCATRDILAVVEVLTEVWWIAS